MMQRRIPVDFSLRLWNFFSEWLLWPFCCCELFPAVEDSRRAEGGQTERPRTVALLWDL